MGIDLERLQEEVLASHTVQWVSMPAKSSKTAPLQVDLHPKLMERWAEKGNFPLFRHQVEAIEAAKAGKHVVVSTGTNSGKSLCYFFPTIDKLLSQPAAKALFLYPTKALAQDQLRKLEDWLPISLRAGVYDGDTPASSRATIRKSAHVLITNPDMLHIGIVPGHENWSSFLKNLRVIVLDELHVYRGVFGSHVANVLRRLLRMCEVHGNRPQVLAGSATIGNPAELFRDLTGLPMRQTEWIRHDASGQAPRSILLGGSPPLEGPAEALPATIVAAEVIARLVKSGVRTLAFCRSRIGVELTLNQVRNKLDDPTLVDSYRGGYTPKERRAIEKALFTGKLKGLIATDALEMGIDVGDLEAVVMVGYPGSVSSFWQQAGRAGRGDTEGLVVYLAMEDPLEQWLVRSPETILDAEAESAVIHAQNPQILRWHLRCAAHEMPLAASELARFGLTALERAEEMERAGELAFSNGRFYYPGFAPPAPDVDIRGAGRVDVRLLLGAEELGKMERWRALQYAHPGAVYLHRGQTYVVHTLDLDSGVANVSATEVDYFTQAMVQSIVEPGESIRTREVGNFSFSIAPMKVTDTVVAYMSRSRNGNQMMDMQELELPPTITQTVGIRLDLDRSFTQAFEGDDQAFLVALHGLEHVMIATAPLLAGCDRGDLGSGWYGAAPDTLRPALFTFDRVEGGIGLSEMLFQFAPEWIRTADTMLRSCSCAEGCPACLLSPRCEIRNEGLDKPGTMKLLDLLLLGL